jgi:hypothetical protein
VIRVAPLPSRLAWRWALRVAALCTVLPLFCARHLPMADLPEHLAVIATLRHYGDPAWRSQEYFSLGGLLDTQYWLYHVVGTGLAYLLGSAERGNVLLLALVGLAYPYSLRALLRAMHMDERLALFGAPVFWSRALTVGLLNFVASEPVLLFALALVVRQAEAARGAEPRARTAARGAGLALLALALFYLHVSSYLLFAGQAALATWMLGAGSGARELLRGLARLPARLAWLAPSAIAALVVVVHGRLAADSTHGVTFTPCAVLLGLLPHWAFDAFRTRVDNVLGWAAVAVGVVLIVLGAPAHDSRERRRRRLAVLLFAAALLSYFSLPATVGGYAGLLDVRMALFVAAFLPLLLRPRAGLAGSVPLAAAAAIAVGIGLDAAWQVHAFEEAEVGHFDDLLRRMPRGGRLLTLTFDPKSAYVESRPFTYFGAYYRARYGGMSSFSFSELHHWPTRYRPEWSPPQALTWGNPCLFRNARDGEFFDFVLTRGDVDPFAANPPGPRWTLIGASRAWRLYARDRSAPETPLVDGESDPGPCAPPAAVASQ